MTKLLIGGAAAAALLALAPALAQTSAPVARQAHQGIMKTHSRAEVAAHIQAMFARVDANRDGAITKAEAEAMRGMRHAKRAERRNDRSERRAQAFERIDTNRDGMIARAEWDAHAAHRQQRMAIRQGSGGAKRSGMRGMGMGGIGGRMFEQADANRDARVTLAEATAAALSHFDRADTNRDGQLTPEERKAMHQRLRGMKQSG